MKKRDLYAGKILEKRDWKEKRAIESDKTSLLINEETNMHIGEIKYKTLLAEKKKLKHFFY